MPDGIQQVVSLQDVCWLGVELGVVRRFVEVAANTVLFTTGDAELDLQ